MELFLRRDTQAKPASLQKVGNRCLLQKGNEGQKMKRKLITDRENEILRLIVEGFSNRQIAERLTLSVRTVETHRANIMKKLKIENLAGLIKYAIRAGITTLDS